MNLLIVDDDVIAVKGLMASVDWKEYDIDKVSTAYNADKAIEILETETIDIMLCDIEMPKQNGIELVRYVRNGNLDIGIIFLTCHAEFKYAVEALRLGCEDYLVRPLPFEEIANAVKKSVEKLRASRQDNAMKKLGEQWISVQEEDRPKTDEARTPKKIAEMVEAYVAEHLADLELSVAAIAKYCCLNGDYLNRLFRQTRGLSIRSYITDCRLRAAAALLNSGNLPANVIAEKVGYKSYAYFSTQFKKKYRCVPVEYRRQTEKS